MVPVPPPAGTGPVVRVAVVITCLPPRRGRGFCRRKSAWPAASGRIHAKITGIGDATGTVRVVGLSALIVDWGGVLDDGAGSCAVSPVLTAARALSRREVAVALLSNAASRDGLPSDEFDAVVISGELGTAKPADRIYRSAAEALGRRAGECVFVDDERSYVDAAVRYGMVGVHHRDPASTLCELEVLFDIELVSP